MKFFLHLSFTIFLLPQRKDTRTPDADDTAGTRNGLHRCVSFDCLCSSASHLYANVWRSCDAQSRAAFFASGDRRRGNAWRVGEVWHQRVVLQEAPERLVGTGWGYIRHALSRRLLSYSSPAQKNQFGTPRKSFNFASTKRFFCASGIE